MWAASCSATLLMSFPWTVTASAWDLVQRNTCGRVQESCNNTIMINSKKLHSGQGADLMVVWAQGWKEDSEFWTLYLCLISDCYLDLQGSTFLLTAWVLQRKLCRYLCSVFGCVCIHSLLNALYFFSLLECIKPLKWESVNILMAKMLITLLLKQDDVCWNYTFFFLFSIRTILLEITYLNHVFFLSVYALPIKPITKRTCNRWVVSTQFPCTIKGYWARIFACSSTIFYGEDHARRGVQWV